MRENEVIDLSRNAWAVSGWHRLRNFCTGGGLRVSCPVRGSQSNVEASWIQMRSEVRQLDAELHRC